VKATNPFVPSTPTDRVLTIRPPASRRSGSRGRNTPGSASAADAMTACRIRPYSLSLIGVRALSPRRVGIGVAVRLPADAGA
jgi:hypothetical protein